MVKSLGMRQSCCKWKFLLITGLFLYMHEEKNWFPSQQVTLERQSSAECSTCPVIKRRKLFLLARQRTWRVLGTMTAQVWLDLMQVEKAKKNPQRMESCSKLNHPDLVSLTDAWSDQEAQKAVGLVNKLPWLLYKLTCVMVKWLCEWQERQSLTNEVKQQQAERKGEKKGKNKSTRSFVWSTRSQFPPSPDQTLGKLIGSLKVPYLAGGWEQQSKSRCSIFEMHSRQHEKFDKNLWHATWVWPWWPFCECHDGNWCRTLPFDFMVPDWALNSNLKCPDTPHSWHGSIFLFL